MPSTAQKSRSGYILWGASETKENSRISGANFSTFMVETTLKAKAHYPLR
nr:MAG TPA: hypothetical protein [Caudoviricetes sp.]